MIGNELFDKIEIERLLLAFKKNEQLLNDNNMGILHFRDFFCHARALFSNLLALDAKDNGTYIIETWLSFTESLDRSDKENIKKNYFDPAIKNALNLSKNELIIRRDELLQTQDGKKGLSSAALAYALANEEKSIVYTKYWLLDLCRSDSWNYIPCYSENICDTIQKLIEVVVSEVVNLNPKHVEFIKVEYEHILNELGKNYGFKKEELISIYK